MPGEPLMATIYEFRPDNNALITLPQLELSPPRLETRLFFGFTPRAIQFRTDCLQRDRRCVISKERFGALQASHLIQKQLGDIGVQSAFQRFSGTGSTPLVDRYDSRLGVMVFLSLDSRMHDYNLGFWNTGSVSLLTFHTAVFAFLILGLRANMLSTTLLKVIFRIFMAQHGNQTSNCVMAPMSPYLTMNPPLTPHQLACSTGTMCNVSSNGSAQLTIRILTMWLILFIHSVPTTTRVAHILFIHLTVEAVCWHGIIAF